MGFMDQLKDTLDRENNVSFTENGAVGYKSTGSALVDINFSVPALRTGSEDFIIDKWEKAYNEDENLAMLWLMFLRDVRGGLGERRSYRIIMKWMAENHPKKVLQLLNVKNTYTDKCGELLPFYGRWDDLLDLYDTECRHQVIRAIRNQFSTDWERMKSGLSISLLAKWLPSLTASSGHTRLMARKMAHHLGLLETTYRQRLSKMRKHLNVIECKMSDQKWDEIDYSAVPSRANVLYAKAFMKHDPERRQKFIDAAVEGGVKMNSGVLYPYEIVSKMIHSHDTDSVNAMEALWKNLPNTVTDPESRTIVVADGSGSMEQRINGTQATALDVAYSLAIYFAERLQGEFGNKFITFSGTPKLVDFSGRVNLWDKVQYARQFNECANTNIEGVFDLILDTAINANMTQDDIPTNILIISDMEFDEATQPQSYGWWGYERRSNVSWHAPSTTLFDAISAKYLAHGYKLPRIVFWNVNSRTGTIPMKQNELGCCMVSGFSTNLATMVMSGKLDPFECLKETLLAPRYAPVAAALGFDEASDYE